MSLPETMQVIEISKFGGPEVLTPAIRPIAVPGPDEALVRVCAAGVNRPDIVQRLGHYPPPKGASDVPGLEIAGEIVALGDQSASNWQIGDTLCALLTGGGYSEFAIAPLAQSLPIPKGLTMTEAAGLPETFFTVWSNVFDRAQLKSGETLLVHGGTSGIGTTTISLATAFGATVYVTAGTDEKCTACLNLGAASAINYKTQDFVEEIAKISQGKGVNVILDMVGGDYFARNLASLSTDGRLVQIAFLNGPRAELDLRQLMPRRLTVTGSTLRPRDIAFKGAIAEALKTKVWPLIEAGRVRPQISAVFPLNEAAQAHTMMEAGQHCGKIILCPGKAQ